MESKNELINTKSELNELKLGKGIIDNKNNE